MSVKIMSLVWERAPYTAGSLIVLLALADWANDEGVAWPSMERLAEKARIDRRSAQRIVRQLEKDGVLEVEHGGGRSRQHKYTLKTETAAFRRCLYAEEKGGISCAETATFDPERATPDPQTATFDPERATPTSPDPSVEPSEDPLEEPSVEPSASKRHSVPKKVSEMSDEQFLDRLQGDAAYAGIDVRKLNSRMIAWCEVNGKRPTRRRLVNWLNRQDDFVTSGNGNGNGTNKQNHELRRPSAAERNNSQLMRNLAVVENLRREGRGDSN